MSSATSVNAALADYAAGRMTAQQLVGIVAAAYYGEGGRGTREVYKPLMEIIERAHPGIVELSGTTEKPGFAVRLAERPFPKRYEAELRQVVAATVTGSSSAASARPGLLSRILRAIRSIFGT